ncbi:MAG: hypothetical protein ACLFN7_01555 [Candidatus Acetothermia bacterium]
MDKLEKDLVQVAEINGLIQELKRSLELFERGEKEGAMERIVLVEERVEALNERELTEDEKIERKLSQVLENLKWVEENGELTS